jgi:lipid II:glycine glycyltransferase (peptidoglycan interpeptide bridge formation enzyme)
LWAEFKSHFGWTPYAFRATAENGDEYSLSVLCRRFAPGLRLAYVPHGPYWPVETERRHAVLRSAAMSLRLLLPSDTFAVRMDPLFEGGFTPAGSDRLRKAPADIQASSTVIVPISGSDDEILAAMKSKWRYNVRLAGKKGVVVDESPPGELENDLRAWYALHRETGERDRIAVHSFEYFRTLFSLARGKSDASSRSRASDIGAAERLDSPRLSLYLARHDGRLLAGVIVARYDGTATYLYGASGNAKRNLMPAYALQFEAMRRAREDRCTSYDLFGIPPTDDPSHPMHGLYRFKTGFGGEVVHRIGSVDFVSRPIAYAVYQLAERARGFYHKTIKKRWVR